MGGDWHERRVNNRSCRMDVSFMKDPCRRSMLSRMSPQPASATSASPPARDASPTGASPLLHAALTLVPPSTTASELEQRFAASGADLRPRIAARLLADLADLGLVRATQRSSRGTRWVATTLGLRYVDAGLHGEASIPLAELEGLRTDLLSTIAHELRTPLTAVRTSVGLLLEPSGGADRGPAPGAA